MATKKIQPNLLFFGNSIDSTMRLEDLKGFRSHVDTFIADKANQIREKADADLDLYVLPLFAESFPPILHSAVIISTAILLEQEMRGFSLALLSATDSEIKFNDLSGSVLERFRTTVTKVARLPLDPEIVGWEDIVGVFEIRNCLAHAGGEMAEFQRAATIRAFAARHGTPDCSEDILQVDTSTSKVTIEIASVFLDGIYNVALAAFPGEHRPRFRDRALPDK